MVSARSLTPSVGSLKVESEYTRRRGRYVPAAVRRAVFEGDEAPARGAASTRRTIPR
jgi:hypothetical protein